MSDVVYIIQKEWKKIILSGTGTTNDPYVYGSSYSMDIEAVGAWLRVNAGPDYVGSSADTSLKIYFINVEPSQAIKDSIDAYIDNIGKDDQKTVTGTALAMTMSANPSYTVKVGDKITVGSETRNIDIVTDQSNYTIDLAFTADPSAAACTVCSIEVHSYVDLNTIETADKALKDGIDPTKTYAALTTAERKVLANLPRTRADLGL